MIPPLNNRPRDHIPPTQYSLSKTIERVLGYLWSTVQNIPSFLYGLITRIKQAASGKFAHKDSSPIKPVPKNVKITPLPPPVLSPQFIGSPKVRIQEDQKAPSEKMLEEKPVIKEAHDEMKDPLKDMGAITNDSDLIYEEDPIKFLIKDREPESMIEDIMSPLVFPSEEGLIVAQGLVERAYTLMKEIDENPPAALEVFFSYIDRLIKESDEVNGYASYFINDSKEGHQLVQKTIDALIGKSKQLEREMSNEIKAFYKPNPAIRGDGNCLFLSANALLKGTGQQSYRKLAADYFRNRSLKDVIDIEDIENPIADAWIRGQWQISAYSKSQGGDEAWSKKLREKLNREPTQVDKYCDCLENSNLWEDL